MATQEVKRCCIVYTEMWQKGQSGASRLRRRYEWVMRDCSIRSRVSCISLDRLYQLKIVQGVAECGNSEEIVVQRESSDLSN